MRIMPAGARAGSAQLVLLLGGMIFFLGSGSAPGATLVVTKTNDSGAGTLRQAILEANTNADLDTIQFNISAGGGGVKTIAPASPLPYILHPVVIDGTTQPGYTGVSPLIELSGSLAGLCNGLEVHGGNSTIKGLTLNRFAYAGLVLLTNDNNQVQACWIGTDSTGTNAAGNGSAGITVVRSSSNLIGGLTSSARNVICANYGGVWLLGGAFNQVQGNYIGMDATGLRGLGNQWDGVTISALEGATDYEKDSLIGGTDPGAGNLLSANGETGVAVFGLTLGPARNRILGNYIGLDRNGSAGWINGDAGILITNSVETTIGGPGAGNIISASRNDGIRICGSLTQSNIIQCNFIGTDLLGLTGIGNTNGIRIVDSSQNIIGGTNATTRNVISGNFKNGIELNGAAATGNAIQGNYIGVDATGQAPLHNGGNGILISTNGASSQAASANTIGGASPGAGNIISGNAVDGVQIGFGATSNSVLGNKIGISSGGNLIIPNRGHGVAIFDSAYNVVGGGSAGAGNTIAGNYSNGVYIAKGLSGTGSFSNSVLGNTIGLFGGGNGLSGVYVKDSSGNWIGGFSASEGNKISYNGAVLQQRGHGVVIESGTNNPILSNLIWTNSGRGIDLGNDSFTLNDVTNSGTVKIPVAVHDLDEGANGLQNFPIVTRVAYYPNAGYHEITWTLSSRTNRSYRIQFFGNSKPDPSGFGEGERLLGSMDVMTDSGGVVIFTNRLALKDVLVSATATDMTEMNTSEFSPIDTDGDGIADTWETRGIDYDEDGTIDLVLNAADPYYKDVFVEIDAMDGRAPLMKNLDRVFLGSGYHDGYANAPASLVQNPNGDNGILVHMELDETKLPLQSWPNDDWGPLHALKDAYFGTPAQHTNANAMAAKRLVYHYCLFADTLTDGSGVAGRGEWPGNDLFIVLSTNASSPTAWDVPAVFMHELGHNLGLGHGGVDSILNKPNYHSVMNYQWAYPGGYHAFGEWVLDYSREAFGTLYETNLVDAVGIVASRRHFLHAVTLGPYLSGTNRVPISVAFEATTVDWNDNTNLQDSASRDITFLPPQTQPSPGQVLYGSEDWSRLKFSFLDDPRAADDVYPDDITNDWPRVALEQLTDLSAGEGKFEFVDQEYFGSETGGVATLTVRRYSAVQTNASISFATADGTATSGLDYIATNGVLSFSAGESLKSFSVSILDDGLSELPETVLLLLRNPTSGATLGAIPEAKLTIIDDDPTNHFTVINTNNSGPGSLRQAIFNANTNPGIALIDFAIPATSGLTISPSTALPAITGIVTLDGTTQPGFSGAPIIELNGSSAGAGSSGLSLSGGTSLVRGMIVNRFTANGIVLTGKGENRVEGCYVGLDRTGTVDQGNATYGINVLSYSNVIGGTSLGARNYISGNNNVGVQLSGTNNLVIGNVVGLGVDASSEGNSIYGIAVAATGNVIGGEHAGERNVISGNDRDGVYITANRNTVLGNYIGTTVAGLAGRANRSNGIAISSSFNNVIGGASLGARNLVSGNGRYGIELAGASDTSIIGNLIGTDSAGQVSLPNQLGGVLLSGASLRNRIGEPEPLRANTVAFNAGPGVFVSSVSASNNVIRGNKIFANSNGGPSALSIDLGGSGVDINDPGDTDTGANGMQNYPVLTMATNHQDGTTIVGTLNSRPNTNYTVDFYASGANVGEGELWIGSAVVTTDAAGDASFTAATAGVYLSGPFITATATDAAGNTSEFSAAVQAISSQPGQTFTVVNTADSGPGSLRQALLDSNAYVSQRNSIVFNIPGSGVQTIVPSSALPESTNPVLIDGYSQPGATPNSAAAGHNGVLLIELNGAQAGRVAGLRISSGNSIVRGLVINRFGTNDYVAFGPISSAIELRGAGGNQITGNFIGTDPTGTLDRGNLMEGIFINCSSNNIVGGAAPELRNIIAATKVTVNTLGIDVSGDGIYLRKGPNASFNSAGNVVQGNLIGVSKLGSPLGNQGFGIRLQPEVTNAVVGGSAPGVGNVIAYNGSTSFAGLVTGGIQQAPQAGNIILGNSIYSNTGLGIDRGGSGKAPTVLDYFPLLGSAFATNGQITIQGRLLGTAGSTYRVEFFANDSFDETGFGEGQLFLGWTNAVAGSDGFATFTASLPYTNVNVQFVTATATDDQNDTSGFSPRLKVNDLATNVFMVNTLDDLDYGSATASHTSLREAIFAANNHPGRDTIGFAAGNGAVWLRFTTSIPAVFDPVILDGTTQPGYAGTPLIYLDGQSTFQLSHATVGLRLSCPSNIVRGFAINGFAQMGLVCGGYRPHEPAWNTIQGNYIGTETTGTTNGNRLQQTGLYVYSSSNLIGGASAVLRNLISFNAQGGIALYFCDGNLIQGNWIGTDRTGTNNIPNGWTDTPFAHPTAGIDLDLCYGTVIGGASPSLRNVISGNGNYELWAIESPGTVVQGNYFGVDATGTFTFDYSSSGLYFQGGEGNLIKDNVLASAWSQAIILDAWTNRVEGNFIGTDATGMRKIGFQEEAITLLRFGNIVGGTNAGSGNVIAGGIDGLNVGSYNVVQGNYIGTAADGVTPLGNSGAGIVINGGANLIGGIGGGGNVLAYNGTGISVPAGPQNAFFGNSIYSDVNLGIDLGANGVTLNDPGDLDAGANNLQNFPVLSSARNTGVATVISGSLNSRSNTQFYIEVFTNSICGPSGYGQGQSFLTSFSTSTDASGNAAFAASYPALLSPGHILTATATDPDNNTSEFSPCVTVVLDTNSVSLALTYSNSSLTLSWPSSASSYLLETATNLNAPISWQAVSNGIATNGVYKTYSLPIGSTPDAQYFRLHAP